MMARVNTVDIIGDESLSAKLIEKSIAEFVDSAMTSIGYEGLYNFKKLTTVDLLSATRLEDRVFFECKQLTALILRSGTVCTATGSSMLSRTPIAGYGGTGYIYVPRALVDTYKVATNWSTYAAQFRALEDYTVDGTVTGELDPNKI